jgi:molybdopterin-guanine dinucleotide biosynthesis adapter protein
VASRRVKAAPRRRTAPVVAFSGPSGAGKTTLLVALLRELRRRGIRVAAIKHSGHPHGFDVPGKDSDLLLRAGAASVAVQGPRQLAVFGPPRPGGARALARLLPPVDLVVVEGWKDERLPRIEVHRRAVGRSFACARSRGFIAVVTDEPPPRPLPTFAPTDVKGLADFLGDRFGLPST